MQQKQQKNRVPFNPYPANQAIRASLILCIDHNGKNHGKIALSEGLRLASQAGLDLVQISYNKQENLPTCKILDYGKFKFETQKKDREQNRKQREGQIKEKEVQLSACTDEHDLEIKARKVAEFLEEGCRVKVVVKFKGRQITHPEVGKETLKQMLEKVQEAQVVSQSFSEKNYVTILQSKK